MARFTTGRWLSTRARAAKTDHATMGAAPVAIVPVEIAMVVTATAGIAPRGIATATTAMVPVTITADTAGIARGTVLGTRHTKRISAIVRRKGTVAIRKG